MFCNIEQKLELKSVFSPPSHTLSQCTLESLRQAKKHATLEHQQEVMRVKTTVTQELEKQWRERMK